MPSVVSDASKCALCAKAGPGNDSSVDPEQVHAAMDAQKAEHGFIMFCVRCSGLLRASLNLERSLSNKAPRAAPSAAEHPSAAQTAPARRHDEPTAARSREPQRRQGGARRKPVPVDTSVMD